MASALEAIMQAKQSKSKKQKVRVLENLFAVHKQERDSEAAVAAVQVSHMNFQLSQLLSQQTHQRARQAELQTLRDMFSM